MEIKCSTDQKPVFLTHINKVLKGRMKLKTDGSIKLSSTPLVYIHHELVPLAREQWGKHHQNSKMATCAVYAKQE